MIRFKTQNVMEFDITHIDKNLLLKALFAHAGPTRLGLTEYNIRKMWGENVDGLTDEECANMLEGFNRSKVLSEMFRIVNYHKGKEMKISFYRNRHGRVVVDAAGYDAKNGKHRFLEAMLSTFAMDEILITKKLYHGFTTKDVSEYIVRAKAQEAVFKDLLKNTILRKDGFVTYWAIDESKSAYTPPFFQF